LVDAKPALWFAFHGEHLLVSLVEDSAEVPLATGLEEFGVDVTFRQEIGLLNGHRCWAAEVSPNTKAPKGMVFRDLRRLFSGVNEEFFRMAGRAKQIIGWHATHRFCGRCGAETGPVAGEMAKKCTRCGMLYYPRLSPAIIVLVRDRSRVLLARSPNFPPGMYSALAGFVEPGEALEEAIRREVNEEVGVEIANVQYFGSQPWPFPNSLMIGFTADYAGGEVRVEPTEIEDANWYAVDDLPMVPPRISIARAMIDHFIEECGGDPKVLETPE
jgi:NAD+ diphosphatase